MKILTLLLGSLAASIAFGGAFAQVSAPQGGYNSPPAYGTSINPPGAEGRSATRPRYRAVRLIRNPPRLNRAFLIRHCLNANVEPTLSLIDPRCCWVAYFEACRT